MKFWRELAAQRGKRGGRACVAPATLRLAPRQIETKVLAGPFFPTVLPPPAYWQSILVGTIVPARPRRRGTRLPTSLCKLPGKSFEPQCLAIAFPLTFPRDLATFPGSKTTSAEISDASPPVSSCKMPMVLFPRPSPALLPVVRPEQQPRRRHGRALHTRGNHSHGGISSPSSQHASAEKLGIRRWRGTSP